METEADTYLPNLSEYIGFEKANEKNIIEVQCADLFEKLGDSIKKVDVYYNPHTTKLEGVSDKMNVYDIRTQKEV